MRIAVVDDHQLFLDEITALVSRCFSKKLHKMPCVDQFLSAFDYKPGLYDILFLDVEMPGENGFQFAERIRKTDAHVPIVFVTCLESKMRTGYFVQAFDYLLKPIEFDDLTRTVDRVLKHLANRKPARVLRIMNKEEGFFENVMVHLADVYYIQCNDHMLQWVTKQQTYTLTGKLDEEEKKIGKFGFLRTHSGYLVNMHYIALFHGSEVTMENGLTLPVARSRLANAKEEITFFRGKR